jgi:hypothetical protein
MIAATQVSSNPSQRASGIHDQILTGAPEVWSATRRPIERDRDLLVAAGEQEDIRQFFASDT